MDKDKTIGKLKVSVESDMQEVTDDLIRLENQVTELSQTISRLNDNGLNIQLKIKVDSKKMFDKLLSFRRNKR